MNLNRLKNVYSLIIFCYLAIIGRLFYWQIIKYPELNQKIINQSYHPSITNPTKGKIYDSQGYPLLLNQTAFQLSLYKPDMTDSDNIKKELSSLSPPLSASDQGTVNNFFENPNQKWVTLKHVFSEKNIEPLKFKGLTFQPINTRIYPENNLAINIIGKNELTGLQGYYRRQLSGKPGFSWESKDATGKTILTKPSWGVESIGGDDIYTSINRQIQAIAEDILKKGVESYSADFGSISILEPKTGQIIALANYYSGSLPDEESFKNPIISNLYEPGSIFKPLVVAMALNSKKINPDYICTQCSTTHQIGKYFISNWDNSFHPNSSLKDIIKNSDNIGMSYIIEKLGLDNFLSYFIKLGLNRKTGIDLLGESKPLAKDIWPEIDFATASFGQGFAITQIQMLQAFNILANNGVIVRPQIRINQKNKENVIFSKETVSQIKSILEYSVENGTVSKFKPISLQACAKSGTAQVAINGGYSDSTTIASYVGFSPCNNPKFTMLVTINNPKTSPWGSSTAAPIWFELASKISLLL